MLLLRLFLLVLLLGALSPAHGYALRGTTPLLRRLSLPSVYTTSRTNLPAFTASQAAAAAANQDGEEEDAVGVCASSSSRAENREIAAIALPAVCSALIDPILSLIDTAWVGAIDSKYALGATAAASELFTMAFAASLALRESSSSTIARLSARCTLTSSQPMALSVASYSQRVPPYCASYQQPLPA